MLTHELVTRQAELSPRAVAVVAGTRVLTYAELDLRANQLAQLLRRRGAGPGAPVGVCLPRGADLVVALLAVWKSGAAYVPVDPGHPVSRTAVVLGDAAPAVVLADESTVDIVRRAGGRPLLVDGTRGLPGDAPVVAVSGDHPAYVLHTSGSTGRPKGVVISHAGIYNRIRWVVDRHGMGPADRVLQKTTLTFDAACWEIFAPLVSGGTIVLAPQGVERDPSAMVRAIAEHDVTILQVVPSVLRALVEEPGWDRCTALRLLFSAGEQLHAELVRRFLDVAGDVVVVNTYGPTECSIDVTAHTFDPIQRTGPVAIGTAIDGMRAVVTDPSGQPVEPGGEGELCAGGIGVAHGYLGRPELTAERFVPDPDGPPGARRYRTGDRVRLRADGNLEYLGRADQQLKINGVRIEAAEVELALLAYPDVLDAAVTSFAAPTGEPRLVAYVRLRESRTPAELAAFLAERLPATHLPAAFVELAAFPTTSSGKVDRSALPAPGQLPDTAPSTADERLVARLWRDLLGVEDIGAHDDFYRLGGSSLQLTRLANRLRAETGTDVTLPALLSATTVAAQARLIGSGRPATAAIPPVPRTARLPLSFGQQRLWLLDQIAPAGREWVSGHFIRVPVGVKERAVQDALDALVARHEALRTRFTARDGEPVQVIDPPRPMDLRIFRVPRDEVGSVVDREADAGFDLRRGPLARALLFPDTEDGHTLVLLMHHIICDGWSAAVLERDFLEILAGRLTSLPPLEIQYADYAVWQRERLSEPVLRAELDHWRGVLGDATPLSPRADRPRPPARDARGAVLPFTIPAELTASLTELGRRCDATPFMTLLASFAVLLARYTAQWDVVIGTPVAGRERPEIEDVVGFFLNSLVLRCRLDGTRTFEQALETVRDVCKEAFAHQELPFEQLVAELAPERDLSRTPLYQVAFDLHDEELTGTPTDPADLSALIEASRVAKTDLTLYLRRQSDGSMHGVLEYATALFERATIDRMARHFQHLLHAVVADPGVRLDSVDFLPGGEYGDLLRWSVNAGPEITASVPRLFEECAAARPDDVALVAGGTTLTFVELDRRANRLARHLRTLGVGPESVVGVLLDRGADLLVALLAVWKAGGAYLPLDPGFPAARTGFMLADAGARVLVTQVAQHESLTGRFAGHIVLVDAHAERLAIAVEDASPVDRPDDLDQLAYVIYTSGSTGRPKGVQLTHRGLANHIRWAVDELATRGTGGAPVFSSVAFDLVMPNIWAPLIAGRPVHVLPQDLDLAQLGQVLVSAAPFGFVKLTPGHLEILSCQLTTPQLAELAEVIVVAGEQLPPGLADRWAAALGDGRLINEYGPTEASVGACTFGVAAPVRRDAVPIGRPLPGVSLHVLDDLLRPVPIGAAGQLHVGGVGVARGYAGQPALTAERFVPDPYGAPGSRLYRTGDLARLLPDGNVDFLGRLDDQVKVRGYRVELGEIANVLREHPRVRDAVVVASGERLIAYCVPAAPAPTGAELIAHCAGRLPGHMLPGSCQLVEAIPLTPNGKLDRSALPAPVGDEDEVTAPRGIVEERIAEIFAELLGSQAGAHTDFFAGGGNSILAIRLIAAIQSTFGVDLPVRAVFEGSTVAGLAAAVEAGVRADIEALSYEELIQEGGTG